MEVELNNMKECKIWTRTTLPPGKKAIGNTWVYKVKKDENGNIERFKARLCAQGFSQRQGIDFDQTFSPVVRIDTLRVVFSIVAAKDLDCNSGTS